MKQPTDAKTIDGPIAALGTYIDLELALSDALGDRLHRTSTSPTPCAARRRPNSTRRWPTSRAARDARRRAVSPAPSHGGSKTPCESTPEPNASP